MGTRCRGRRKKLIYAVAVLAKPKDFPCDTCDCVDGRSTWNKWRIDAIGVETRHCLRQQITPRTLFFLGLYRHYCNGVLPVAGGLLDQPASYVRAMSVLDEWMKRSGKS